MSGTGTDQGDFGATLGDALDAGGFQYSLAQNTKCGAFFPQGLKPVFSAGYINCTGLFQPYWRMAENVNKSILQYD